MNRTALLHHIADVGGHKGLFAKTTLTTLRESCAGNSELEELLKETVEQCVKYAQSVVEFVAALNGDDQEELNQIDQSRHYIHEATDSSVKILSRNMTVRGRDGSWIRFFPNRAAIGSLAVQIAFARLKEEVSNE